MTTRIGSDDERGNALVTGAAGFIGSHLTERLLADGWRVWGLDNFDAYYSPETKRRNLEPSLGNGRMHLVEGDVRDGVLIDGLAGDVSFDVVFHLAALPGARASVDSPGRCYSVNVDGTRCLLEGAVRNGVGRFVFASSASVYGEATDPPFREDAPADRPLTPYAATKRAAEMLCHVHRALYSLPVACLRLFTVYGPRQRPDLAIHEFARRMYEGEPITVCGDGTSARDYTYVADVVDGLVRASDHLEAAAEASEAPFEILNLGSGRSVQLSDLVERVAAAMEVVDPVLEALPSRRGEVRSTHADVSRAADLLGYEAATGLDDGLAEFAAWFRSEPGRSPSPAASGAMLAR